MIALIAYHVLQISATNFGANSTILQELSETPRNKTSTQVTEDITTMFYSESVPNWAKVMDTSDYPHDYFIIFSGFVCNILYIALGAEVAFPIAELLLDLIVPGDPAVFIIMHYLPELTIGISKLKIKAED